MNKLTYGEALELLEWAETLLCNSLPQSHCTQEDWNATIKKWRDKVHGVKKEQT